MSLNFGRLRRKFASLGRQRACFSVCHIVVPPKCIVVLLEENIVRPKWLSVKRKYVLADPHNALVQPSNVPAQTCDVLVEPCNVPVRACNVVPELCDVPVKELQIGFLFPFQRFLVNSVAYSHVFGSLNSDSRIIVWCNFDYEITAFPF